MRCPLRFVGINIIGQKCLKTFRFFKFDSPIVREKKSEKVWEGIKWWAFYRIKFTEKMEEDYV
jgi:hypothetical protein